MNEALKNSINEFINAVKDTSEYRSYKANRITVMTDPELRGKASKLMKEHYRLLTRTEESELLDAEIAFFDKYEEDYNIPEIHDFLDAEVRFNEMLQEVMEQVTGGLSI